MGFGYVNKGWEKSQIKSYPNKEVFEVTWQNTREHRQKTMCVLFVIMKRGESDTHYRTGWIVKQPLTLHGSYIYIKNVDSKIPSKNTQPSNMENEPLQCI